MDQVRAVVDALNQPPFEKKLTLVEFHNLRPIELLQVVNDVFAQLDPQMARDLRDEPPEQRATRMLEFLLVLNCPHGDLDNIEYGEQFMAGSPKIVHALLFWMLGRMPQLAKRAYLRNFLSTFEVPQEHLGDAIVMNLRKKYEELQAEFKEVHRAVDESRVNPTNPAELEREIHQLDQEREQLVSKLERLEQRVQSQAASGEIDRAQFDDIRNATHQLRLEQEEETKLYHSIHEEKQRVVLKQRDRAEVEGRLRELEQSDLAKRDPRHILDNLKAQVERQRKEVDESLEKDLAARAKELRDLGAQLTMDHVPPEAVDQLESDIQELEHDVAELTQQRDALHSKEGMKFFRERATAAEHKHDKVTADLQEVTHERQELESDMAALDRQLGNLSKDGKPPVTDAQMREYMIQLSRKTNVYKKNKAALQAGRDEVQVLLRTETILRSRADNLKEFALELEKERGVEGFSQEQELLEKVSMQKADIDQDKGKTLEDISRVVEEINRTLKMRRTKLQPRIKELKAVKAEFDELEESYLTKKRAYDAMCSRYTGDSDALEKEYAELQASLRDAETRYHTLNCEAKINEARLQQAQEEAGFFAGKGKLSNEYRTYTDMYRAKIAREEAITKKLKKEQQAVVQKKKQVESSNTDQQRAFTELAALLRGKLEASKNERARQRATEEDAGSAKENFLKVR